MAQLKINTTIDGQTAWHAGNDGTGSGLDADLLDGQHASAFSTSGHTHTSAGITDFAEAVSDQIGTMVTGNTETGITVTYQDADNTLDFTIAYGTPVTLNPDAANSAGSGNTAARANHVHNVPAASAVSISDATSNAEGVSTSFARADHTHAVTGFATSSHNHNADYVNITGDTMTGDLNITTSDLTITASNGATATINEFGELDFLTFGAGDTIITAKVSGDTQDRININSNGEISWGSGSGAPDIILYRGGAAELTLIGDLTLEADPTSNLHAATKQYVDANDTPTDSGWTTVTKAANWGAGDVKLRKIDDTVIMTFSVTIGTTSTGTTLCTLDAADRPSIDIWGAGVSNSGGGVVCQVLVESSTGNVKVYYPSGPGSSNSVRANMTWFV